MFAVDQTLRLNQGTLPGSQTVEVMTAKPRVIWGFQTSEDLSQVIDAWRLVYHAYREAGYIPTNPYKIYTVPQAIQTTTAVFHEQTGPSEGSAISAILDGPKGLPLDTVYRDELDAMRGNGNRLLEFGLLADTSAACDNEDPRTKKHNPQSRRYPTVARMGDSLANVFRHAFWYARRNDVTDIVVGVNPKHAPFYQRIAGFRRYTRSTSYQRVNNAPVVLLRCNLERRLNAKRRQEGLTYCLDYPPVKGAFDRRYGFDREEIRDSIIGNYLRRRARLCN